eukprot:scaffold117484_cov72-Phaeocystis_antarctica.AAC.1
MWKVGPIWPARAAPGSDQPRPIRIRPASACGHRLRAGRQVENSGSTCCSRATVNPNPNLNQACRKGRSRRRWRWRYVRSSRYQSLTRCRRDCDSHISHTHTLFIKDRE